MTLSVQAAPPAESDAELAARISAGDERAFEALMRRCNARLFRVARSILKDDADAEDALQEAYLQAHRRMQDFRGARHPELKDLLVTVRPAFVAHLDHAKTLQEELSR